MLRDQCIFDIENLKESFIHLLSESACLPNRNKKDEKIEKKTIDLELPSSQTGTAEPSKQEAENLTNVRKLKQLSPASKIGVIFIAPGILSLVLSIINNSQVLAFIGLGLTFWGAIFFLIRPTKYIQGSLLDATAVASYRTIDRITENLKYKGKSFYIPSYPKQAYLPEHLKGLKEMIVFISASGSAGLPSIEEMARNEFILQKPKGISITPPGLGLLNQFENELKIDPTKMDLPTLCETLPQLVLENFQLAKEIKMTPNNDQVNLKISGSIFRGLYLEEGLRSVYTLGCPLVSTIACAIAKTTGKVVTINSLKLDQETDITEASYQITKD
jgi:hypothetical protein